MATETLPRKCSLTYFTEILEAGGAFAETVASIAASDPALSPYAAQALYEAALSHMNPYNEVGREDPWAKVLEKLALNPSVSPHLLGLLVTRGYSVWANPSMALYMLDQPSLPWLFSRKASPLAAGSHGDRRRQAMGDAPDFVVRVVVEWSLDNLRYNSGWALTINYWVLDNRIPEDLLQRMRALGAALAVQRTPAL